MRVAALLPRVGHRQWTLSLPFTLRFQVVKKPQLLKRLEVRLVRAVWRWQRREARRHGVTAALRGGAVVFTQWIGSMLQLTPHLHVLLPEAQWTGSGEAVEVHPPTDDDVAAVLARVLRQAKKDFGRRGLRTSTRRACRSHSSARSAWRCPRRPDDVASRWAMASRCTPTPQCMAMTDRGSSDWPGMARGGPVAESRLRRLEDGRYEYSPKKGVTFIVTAAQLVRRLRGAAREDAPHQLPWRLRPARGPSPAGDTASTNAWACPPCLAQEASSPITHTRLGQSPPAHLWHRRPALPLWRPPPHHRHPLHSQGRRGAPPPTGPSPRAATPPPAGHGSARLARWLSLPLVSLAPSAAWAPVCLRLAFPASTFPVSPISPTPARPLTTRPSSVPRFLLPLLRQGAVPAAAGGRPEREAACHHADECVSPAEPARSRVRERGGAPLAPRPGPTPSRPAPRRRGRRRARRARTSTSRSLHRAERAPPPRRPMRRTQPRCRPAPACRRSHTRRWWGA